MTRNSSAKPAGAAGEGDALRVESWPIERPQPYPQNPRVVPASAVAKVARSIAEFGFRQPIVVDQQDVVLVGHTRLLAARQLGLTAVPVHVARGLSAAQARAYRLADNRTGEETGWDAARLGLELADLADLGLELDLTGFAADELAVYLGSESVGRSDPDFVPEPPAQPLVRPGDLWQLGEQRLLCGDATQAEDVVRVMAGERASALVTDPPYLVNYRGDNRPPTWANGGKAGRQAVKDWDAYVDPPTAEAFYVDFLRSAAAHALEERAPVYQFFAALRAPIVFAAWEAVGLLLHEVLIWQKSRRPLGRSDYAWTYEPIAYGWAKGKRPPAARRPPAGTPAVWEIPSAIEDGAGGVHPTMKPLECFRRPLLYHTRAGEAVYEPFAGSGTAIIACEQLGRRCRAIELAPLFCDVILCRYELFTGRKVVLLERA
jgi:DNA modification methylase